MDDHVNVPSDVIYVIYLLYSALRFCFNCLTFVLIGTGASTKQNYTQ